MKITRFCYSPEGTFSKAEVGGKAFYFCEPPWANNEPFISCIPEGTYTIRQDMSGEYQGFELQSVNGRTEIEIHVGNNMNDTAGCLLPGKGLGYVKGHWAVVNSKAAMRELKSLILRENVTQLEITSVFSKKTASSKKKSTSAKTEDE